MTDDAKSSTTDATTAEPPRTGVVLTPEQTKRRRARSVALGLTLFALVVLFYVVTVYKLGANLIGGGS